MCFSTCCDNMISHSVRMYHGMHFRAREERITIHVYAKGVLRRNIYFVDKAVANLLALQRHQNKLNSDREIVDCI